MLYYQISEQLLEYINNISNPLDKRLDNNKKDIRQSDKDKQRPITLFNFTFQNELLNKLSSTIKKVTFSKAKFPAFTAISNTWYKQIEIQNKNLFYLFYD